jgi:hypothetical protein
MVLERVIKLGRPVDPRIDEAVEFGRASWPVLGPAERHDHRSGKLDGLRTGGAA